MTFDVCYSLRGEAFCGRVYKVVKTEAAARKAAMRLQEGVIPNLIHFTITCEDGRTIHSTRRDGLL
jgi:hypothetical protein